MHAARIGKDHCRPIHEGHERQVRQRLNQVNVALTLGGQNALHRLTHIGIEMDRIDPMHPRKTAGQLGDRLADGLEAGTEILAPMTRDQHDRVGVP